MVVPVRIPVMYSMSVLVASVSGCLALLDSLLNRIREPEPCPSVRTPEVALT